MKRLTPTLIVAALLIAACGSESGSEAVETTPTTTNPSSPSAENDSEFVRQMQEELNYLGYHAGTVDGVWGPQTSEALAAFQDDSNLDSTGRYDPATEIALADNAGDADASTVQALQEKLSDIGYYDEIADGLYGPATESAVRAYQETRGLEVNGHLTHETVIALGGEHAETVEKEHLESAQELGIGGSEKVASEPPDGSDDLLRQGDEGPEVQELQRRLTELGYRPGTPDGRFGAATASAVLAFEKAEGLDRDGIAGPEVISRLDTPRAAGPKNDAPGPRVEVDLDRQILFLIDAGGNVTTINVSTGSGREYQTSSGTAVAYTPDGDFTIERSIDGLRKAALGTLYRPLYFKEGWAIHGSAKIPAYPASHGCVRTANWDQDYLWTVLSEGDVIEIDGHNPGDATAGQPGA